MSIIRLTRGLGREGSMALAVRRRVLQEDEDVGEEGVHSATALGSAPHSGQWEGGGGGGKEEEIVDGDADCSRSLAVVRFSCCRRRSLPCLPHRVLLNISVAARAASLDLRRNTYICSFATQSQAASLGSLRPLSLDRILLAVRTFIIAWALVRPARERCRP